MSSSILILSLILLALCNLVVGGRSKFPRFVIQGTLKCRGEPISGNIMMLDDEWPVDHLLNERTVLDDGKFRMHGDPTSDCLKVVLVVDHDCHNMRYGRRDSEKLKAHSKIHISVEELIKNNWNLEMDIELSEHKVKVSTPLFSMKKAAIFFKRIFNDSYTRVVNLPIWKRT